MQACGEFYIIPEKKYRGFADYFVYSNWKTPASPYPSGFIQLFMTGDKPGCNTITK